MRKIIFLLVLSCGLAGYSQECVPPTVDVFPQSQTCPDGMSIAVQANDIEQFDEIQFQIFNLTTNNEEFILLQLNGGETSLGINFGPYPAGTELEIFVIGFTGGVDCATRESAFITIPSCLETDLDGDGYNAIEDCNDSDTRINPGATEICNLKDDDCDNKVDEDVNFTYYYDADEDGYGDPSRPIVTCSSTPSGFLVDNSEDCDDQKPEVNPGVLEICGNSTDDNCDGFIDENCDNCLDSDSDGICDDIDNCPILPNPGQEPDRDCDGFPSAIDCNDNDASVRASLLDDTDEDGIADCIDQELNSPCPLQVDNKGVSIDSDNDGTPNCQDDCPNDRNSMTAPCPCTSTKDTDGDGKIDCIDLELRSPCPNDVNSDGISNDEDHDGVPNCQDVCPLGDDKIDTDRDKIPDACDDYTFNRGEPICHVGNNGTSKTIYVSPQQKARHLAHGDEPGACIPLVGQAQTTASSQNTTLNDEKLILYPNPANDELNVQVNSQLSSGAVLGVYDMNGNIYININVEGERLYTLELDSRFLAGVYFVKVTEGDSEVVKQFIINK